MTTYIYGLIDPRTSECRYVGKADNMGTRLRKHISSSETHRTPKATWLRKLTRLGLKPSIIELEATAKGGAWIEAEQFWIAYLTALGARLTNATLGGEGAEGCSPSEATRKLMSEKTKARLAIFNPSKGTVRSAEARKAISEKAKGRVWSEEAKKKMVESNRLARLRPEVIERFKMAWARPVSTETRKKISEAGKGRVSSPETRKKQSEAHKGKIRSPEHCARISAAKKGTVVSDATKAKQSAVRKGVPKSPEHKANMAAAKRLYWAEWRAARGAEPSRSTKRRWETGEIAHTK